MHRYWTIKRPVLHRYFVPVKYWSLPVQLRSFSPVLEQEFSGLFRPVLFPVLTVPFRSDTAPLYRREKTAAADTPVT